MEDITGTTVILMAEDDEAHAELIRKSLVRLGLPYPIKRFRNGQEVADFFFDSAAGGAGPLGGGNRYLLLLDIRMPKLDGIEVLRLIRSAPELKGLPVIMISTAGDPLLIEMCYKIGCSDFISKPVNCEKFVNAMKPLGFYPPPAGAEGVA